MPLLFAYPLRRVKAGRQKQIKPLLMRGFSKEGIRVAPANGWGVAYLAQRGSR